MENFVETLAIIRPNQQYVIKAPGRYEDLVWHHLNDTEKPTEAECLAVADQAAAAAATKRTARQWKRLRAERDRRMAVTDWWASSDRTMTAEQTTYRQALRDLPANTDDPANPTWPTKPEVN
jgi:hypothetical protein